MQHGPHGFRVGVGGDVNVFLLAADKRNTYHQPQLDSNFKFNLGICLGRLGSDIRDLTWPLDDNVLTTNNDTVVCCLQAQNSFSHILQLLQYHKKLTYCISERSYCDLFNCGEAGPNNSNLKTTTDKKSRQMHLFFRYKVQILLKGRPQWKKKRFLLGIARIT